MYKDILIFKVYNAQFNNFTIGLHQFVKMYYQFTLFTNIDMDKLIRYYSKND